MTPFSVDDICQWTGGRLVNADRLGGRVSSIGVLRPAPLGVSRPDECAFFFSKEYMDEVVSARCGVLVTAEPFYKGLVAHGHPLLDSCAIIVCSDPYLAMAKLSERFAPGLSTVAAPAGVRGAGRVHQSASVSPEARIGAGVVIDAGCVVEAGAKVGDGTRLYPNCYLGPGAQIGSDCVLFPNVVIYEEVQVGDRVRIHANTTIGSDGFGYAPVRDAADPKKVTAHQKIYHLGRVVIGDEVELGACVTIDRGTFGETRVDRMAKLDNQVHVGHNAHVEEGAVLCGGTCLAGGAIVGRFAYVGGLTGITNRVRVGEGAQVGALALVTKDVEPGRTAVGNPQREYKEHFRAHAALNRLLAERKRSHD